jgi:ABC-type uncharacterized transport system involved in gliding motility auxiliary subunit
MNENNFNKTPSTQKKPSSPDTPQDFSVFLWAGTGILLLALLFSRIIYPELVALTVILSILLMGGLTGLILQNRKALRSRTAAYGFNSVITVALVFGIVSVLNFLGYRYPSQLDTTHNKVHTLSDQSVKLLKSLKTPVQATYFAKTQQKEQFRPLLENYKAINPQFEVEYIDPDREPNRVKMAGVKKYGTLVLTYRTRENKVEDISEEKITNSLIKILKDKSPTLCTVIGHGEKNFEAQDAEGYQIVKKALMDQSYLVKDLSIIQETKVPDYCDAVALIGPTKMLLQPEVHALRDYLDRGGRAILAIDINLKGPEANPELLSLLDTWHVHASPAFVVDPLSRMFGVDASVAIIPTFNREHSITKDFQTQCVFPFTRPLEIKPGAPVGMNVQWLAQTTPKSWAVTDFGQIAKGEIRFHEGKDAQGPLNAAVTVEGKQKDSKATRDTRLVVFGSSFFATNHVSRNAGNLDFFVNSVSWAMEDESLISIRTKEEAPGKIELSQKAATAVGLLTIFVIPLLIAVGGVVIWVYRRKL